MVDFKLLLQAVRNTVVDEAKRDDLVGHLRDLDQEFEKRSREKMVTEEFLSRAYSL